MRWFEKDDTMLKYISKMGVVAGVWLLAALLAGGQNEAGKTLQGFQVPEYDEQGNLKSQLFGDYAEILPDGSVQITNLRIEAYEKGQKAMEVTAPACLYNERTKQATSDTDIKIERDNMIVTGTGFAWDSAQNRIEIQNNVKVVLKNVQTKLNTGESS